VTASLAQVSGIRLPSVAAPVRMPHCGVAGGESDPTTRQPGRYEVELAVRGPANAPKGLGEDGRER